MSEKRVKSKRGIPTKGTVSIGKGFYVEGMNSVSITVLILNGSLSNEEISFLGYFSRHLDNYDNTISMNERTLTYKEISEAIDQEARVAKNIVRRLVVRDIINIREEKDVLNITANPFILLQGESVSRETYNLFENSVFNPYKAYTTGEISLSTKKLGEEALKINISKKETRNSPKYLQWREKVLKRDEYECKLCGKTESVDVHHLNAYKWAEDQRVDVDNGVVLCKTHHRLFHSVYGKGKNTKSDFEEFSYIIENKEKNNEVLINLNSLADEMIAEKSKVLFEKGIYYGIKAANSMINDELNKSGIGMRVGLKD